MLQHLNFKGYILNSFYTLTLALFQMGGFIVFDYFSSGAAAANVPFSSSSISNRDEQPLEAIQFIQILLDQITNWRQRLHPNDITKYPKSEWLSYLSY